MLQLLEDEGLVAGQESDGRRRFALTDEGRAEADRLERPPWETIAEEGDAGAGLREAGFQLGAAVMHAARTGNADQVAQVREVLLDARKRIYSILGDGAAS
jgi:DNA-binding PadR family transcriptional regulator